MSRLASALLFALLAPVLSGQTAIRSIQINQAIGVQKNGARKFVAGKNTVIRAFLESAAGIDSDLTRAVVTRNGQQVVILQPNNYENGTTVVDFLCPNMEACGNWAAGSYTFEVMVNGVTSSTAGTSYDFLERRRLRILALPVTANYNGTVVPVTDSKWKNFGSFVSDTYPIARGNFEWIIRDDFDASGPEFDLETDQGRLNLWEALAKLIPAHCGADAQGDGCFNQVFGFIHARPNGYPNGNLQGYTYGPPANIGVVTDEDAPATVAHEIGHTFGLGDTYDGGTFNCRLNPAPDTFEGKDWDDRSKTVRCQSGRAQLENVSGTKIPASHHPYEIAGRGSLGDMAEYMGSGGPQSRFWTTQDAYDHLFDSLAPIQTQATLRTSSTPLRGIQCFGLIRRNATSASDVSVDPCWTFYDSTPIPNTTGRYMLVAVSATGVQLATQDLDPEFDPVGSKGHAPRQLESAPFMGEMAFPEGTSKLQIISDGKVVMEIPVSANEPVVSNVLVTPSASGSDAQVTWNANDADGGSLAYQVEYNADVEDPNDDWEVVDRDITERSHTLDLSEMAGGARARVRVWATDGVHTTMAESASFVVPPKAPEVFIEPLENGGVHRLGEELILDGEAYDLQDDEIPDSNLRWTSNISGALGTGATLRVMNLPKGVHTITLTATNSSGLSGTDTILVHVATPRRRAVRK